MGKKQHQSDRLFVRHTELNPLSNRRQPASGTASGSASAAWFPWDYCMLLWKRCVQPVSTVDGYVFEADAIRNYIEQYKQHPFTNTPLNVSDLIPLHFSTSSTTNELQCPITFKAIENHTKVVFIRTSGNVYPFDTINTYCLKGNTLSDLITNEPFTKGDIIQLKQPEDLDRKNLSTITKQSHHDIKPETTTTTSSNVPTDEKESPKPFTESGIRHNSISEKVMAELAKSKQNHAIQSAESSSSSNDNSDKKLNTTTRNAVSLGLCAASFTSTAFTPATKTQTAQATELEYHEELYTYIRKHRRQEKAYVQLITEQGPLNMELFVGQTPRTCHNFLTLCSRDYYNGTKCHRLIPGFMAQFGDPTGKGNGGRGAFARTFQDEFTSSLHHDKRGIISMANCGSNTNSSQFFITFASCLHLDGKHTIFGNILESLATLDKFERIPTFQVDNKNEKTDDSGAAHVKDEPKTPIQIVATNILRDPFPDIITSFENQKKKIGTNSLVASTGSTNNEGSKLGKADFVTNVRPSSGIQDGTVGRYLDPRLLKDKDDDSKKRNILALASSSSSATVPNTSISTSPDASSFVKRFKGSTQGISSKVSSVDIAKSKRFGSVF